MVNLTNGDFVKIGVVVLTIKQKKTLKFLLYCGLFVLFLLVAHHPSSVHKGFPEPLLAFKKEINEEDQYVKYNWAAVPTAGCMPEYYHLTIRLWGWTEVTDEDESECGLRIYKKDGEKVSVYATDGEMSIGVEK
jgi:hypothetical protein